MENNIILLNVFSNNTINYLVSKQYNTLSHTYLKYRVTNKKKISVFPYANVEMTQR